MTGVRRSCKLGRAEHLVADCSIGGERLGYDYGGIEAQLIGRCYSGCILRDTEEYQIQRQPPG